MIYITIYFAVFLLLFILCCLKDYDYLYKDGREKQSLKSNAYPLRSPKSLLFLISILCLLWPITLPALIISTLFVIVVCLFF